MDTQRGECMPRTTTMPTLSLLVAGCLLTMSPQAAAQDDFSHPFAPTSIWNRPIPEDAQFAVVQDAIWGDPKEIPAHISLDLVSLHLTDPTFPVVAFRLTRGWNHPARSRSRGNILFKRRLSRDAGTELQ